jgi:hypothetical protein
MAEFDRSERREQKESWAEEGAHLREMINDTYSGNDPLVVEKREAAQKELAEILEDWSSGKKTDIGRALSKFAAKWRIKQVHHDIFYDDYELDEDESFEGELDKIRDMDDFERHMNKYFEEKGKPSDVAYRLAKYAGAGGGLTPRDLLEGDRQIQAVSVVFAGQPLLRRHMLDVLKTADPSSDIHKQALAVLDKVANIIQQSYESIKDAEEAKEELALSGVTGGVVKGFKNIGDYASRNPGEALAYFGGAALFLTLAYQFGGEKIKTAMKTVGVVGGVTVGGALSFLALDKVVGNWRDNNRGLFDMIGWHPDFLNEDDQLDRFRGLMADMLPGNKQAADDLIRLATTPADDILDVFEPAYIDSKGAITAFEFLNRSSYGEGIDKKTMKAMDGAATYKGIEYIMERCARRSLEENEDQPEAKSHRDMVKIGIEYFRENFVNTSRDWPLYLVLQELSYPTGGKGSIDDSGGGLSLDYPSGDVEMGDINFGKEVLSQFKAAGLDVAIEPLSTERNMKRLRINGYIFEVEHLDNGGAEDTLVFRDTWSGGIDKTFTIPMGRLSKKAGESLAEVVDHANERMRNLFVEKFAKDKVIKKLVEWHNGRYADDQIGSGEEWKLMKFNLEDRERGVGHWYLDPPLIATKYAGINYGSDGGKEIPLKILVHDKLEGALSIYSGGKPYFSFDELVKAHDKNEAVHSHIRRDLAKVVGGLEFEITEIDDADTSKTVVKFKYGKNGNAKGSVTYLDDGTTKGIIDIRLSPNPALEASQAEVARKRAESFIDSIRTEGETKAFLASFEGHWNEDSLIKEGESLFGRLLETWTAKGGNEAALFYDREAKFEETLFDLKMREFELMLAEEYKGIISGSLSSISASSTFTQPDFALTEKQFRRDLFSQFDKMARSIDMNASPGGEDLERTLIDETRRLDRFGYDNSEYLRFVNKLDLLMTNQDPIGEFVWDWKGADGMAAARAIRNEIRVLALDYCGILPTRTASNPRDKQYLDYFYKQIVKVLKIAQKSPGGNFNLILTEDRRINSAAFKTALDDLNTVKVEEFDPAVHGGIATATGTAGGAPSAGASGSLEPVEKERVIETGKTKIEQRYEDLFEDAMGYPFIEALIEKQIEDAQDEFAEAVRMGGDPYDLIQEHSLTRPSIFKANVGSSNTNTLRENLILNPLDGTAAGKWHASTLSLSRYLMGDMIELKKGYVFDDMSIATEIMDIWYWNIANGDVAGFGTDDTPENYLNYFIDELKNASTSGESISRTEWDSDIKADFENSLDDFAIWKGAPDIREEAELEQKIDKLEKNFWENTKKTRDLDGLPSYSPDFLSSHKKALEGEFDRSVEDRLHQIKLRYSDDATEFRKKLDLFADFIEAEKLIYQDLISKGLTKEQITSTDPTFEEIVIDISFDSNFFIGDPRKHYKFLNASYDAYLESNKEALEVEGGSSNLRDWFNEEGKKVFSAGDLAKLHVTAFNAMQWESLYRADVEPRLQAVEKQIEAEKAGITPANRGKAEKKIEVLSERFKELISAEKSVVHGLALGGRDIDDLDLAYKSAVNTHYDSYLPGNPNAGLGGGQYGKAILETIKDEISTKEAIKTLGQDAFDVWWEATKAGFKGTWNTLVPGDMIDFD